MKTTHQVARELLALPDVKLTVELWVDRQNHQLAVEMTEYDPEGTAIIWQKPTCNDKT